MLRDAELGSLLPGRCLTDRPWTLRRASSRRGVVHRDVKLDNLLLVREGDVSHVKLADFG